MTPVGEEGKNREEGGTQGTYGKGLRDKNRIKGGNGKKRVPKS